MLILLTFPKITAVLPLLEVESRAGETLVRAISFGVELVLLIIDTIWKTTNVLYASVSFSSLILSSAVCISTYIKELSL